MVATCPDSVCIVLSKDWRLFGASRTWRQWWRNFCGISGGLDRHIHRACLFASSICFEFLRSETRLGKFFYIESSSGDGTNVVEADSKRTCGPKNNGHRRCRIKADGQSEVGEKEHNARHLFGTFIDSGTTVIVTDIQKGLLLVREAIGEADTGVDISSGSD